MIQVLEFDRWYRKQEIFENAWSDWIDFTKLEGTNGYCDEEAVQIIMKQTAPYMTDPEKWQGGMPVTWIGNGNYHYTAYLLMNQLKKPFSLIVFDHHTDMQPSFFAELLSCGSWILHALESVSFLKEVVLLGVKEELLEALSDNPDICFSDREENSLVENGTAVYQFTYKNKPVTAVSESFFQKEQYDKIRLKEILEEQLSYPVYLSIDKDVLRREDCITNWDSGSMSITQMMEICGYILREYQMIGMDVCGEGNDREEEKALMGNRFCNQKLLDLVLQQ